MAHCHEMQLMFDIPEGAKKIVLTGNPNVGKSVFFNALTGLYVDVSNYPGTTLDISYGYYGKDVIIDTPGVYGISSFNDEERIARDVVLEADLVVNIVDAVHLERDLFLTQQIIDTGVPVIVALNMLDEARKKKMHVDIDLLSDLLGVPVIPTVATQKEGLDLLKEKLFFACPGHINADLKENMHGLMNRVGSQGEALLVLEEDETVAARHGIMLVEHEGQREAIYVIRRERVNDVVNHVLSYENGKEKFGTRLGYWMIRPATGIPILFITFWLMYKAIGVFVAGTIVGITEETIMLGMYEPFVRKIVGPLVISHPVLDDILIGEFGILTMAPTYVLGLLLPLVAGFYLFLSILEDSGYLPRIATLTDRVLMRIGLNGRGIIPMILGFGCVTMATITTRLLGSEREKRIAIFLLGLVIPCSAQLGVIMGLLSHTGPAYVSLYMVVITAVTVIAGTVLNHFLPGQTSDLFIDLPPLRLPRLDNVVKKTATKSYGFVKEAAPLFALGALLISMMQVTGFLTMAQQLLAPLTIGLLGLPAEAATAFIMGIVRRDFGAAGLNMLHLTAIQTIIALITITLFVPCIASILVMFKERSKKEAGLMWLGTWVIAFGIGGMVSVLYRLFNGMGEYTAIIMIGIIFTMLMLLTAYLTKSSRKKSNYICTEAEVEGC